MTVHFDNNCSAILYRALVVTTPNVNGVSYKLGNCEKCIKWANISHTLFRWDFYDNHCAFSLFSQLIPAHCFFIHFEINFFLPMQTCQQFHSEESDFCYCCSFSCLLPQFVSCKRCVFAILNKFQCSSYYHSAILIHDFKTDWLQCWMICLLSLVHRALNLNHSMVYFV